jgi:hypothetical protein
MEYKKIIADLYLCAAKCDDCYISCLIEKKKSKFDLKKSKYDQCMMYCEDCSELCKLAAMVVEKNSASASKFLRLCAEICNDCAQECEKHHDDHCLDCAIACHRCADTCLELQLMPS